MSIVRAARLMVLCLLSAGLTAGICLGGEERGEAQITLNGGRSGPVPFPHQRHQTVLQDCNLCHSVFAQTAGVIDAMKGEKKLKKKQVMNKQCIKCHRATKKAGGKSGPTTCRKCHVKI